MPNKNCERCGAEVPFPSAVLCTNCWEVESRLDDYLQSLKGCFFVVMRLGKHKSRIELALASTGYNLDKISMLLPKKKQDGNE